MIDGKMLAKAGGLAKLNKKNKGKEDN